MAFGIGFVGGSLISARVAKQIGPRAISLGTGLMCSGLLGIVALAQHAHGAPINPHMLFLILIWYGAGQGLALPTLVSSAVGSSRIPPQEAGSAAGVFSMVQQVAFALGVAVIMGIFFTQLGHETDGLTYENALSVALTCTAGLLAVTCALAFAMPRRAPGGGRGRAYRLSLEHGHPSHQSVTEPCSAFYRSAGAVKVRRLSDRTPFHSMRGPLVTRLDRYIFHQLLVAIIAATSALVALIWLTQSLRFVELVVNRGLSMRVFLQLTGLLIPNFVAVILPITTFVVVQFVYQRLSGDRELTVMRSTGMSPFALARPALALATLSVIACFILNVWVVPASYASFREYEFEIRNRMAAFMLQEGVFTPSRTT